MAVPVKQNNFVFFSYYDGDQEKLFSEAHIVNPFKSSGPARVQKVWELALCNYIICRWQMACLNPGTIGYFKAWLVW